MTLSIFCPLCKRKNDADATHCNYCGIQFVSIEPEVFTTDRVSSETSSLIGRSSRCADYLEDLPEGGLALFIKDEKDPIVVEDVIQVILGRHVQDTEMLLVDLTGYGAVESGVSRRHVQISYNDGIYTVMDLGSTNGTWLNQRRLAPGQTYQMDTNDQLLLGQLRLFVCFHTDVPAQEVSFFISDDAIPTELHNSFTPHYLATTITPFLEAIIEVQHVIEACQGRPPRDVHIVSLRALRREPLVTITLDGCGDAIKLIQTWVTPWRKAYYEMQGERVIEATDPQMQRDLKQLAKMLLGDVVADPTDVDTTPYSDKLAPALTTLTTSTLELSVHVNTAE